MVNRLTTRLSNRGFSVVSLSGELSQNERTHALQAMRDGRARVCVATDVAARGIDLPNLDLVVHAELPSSHETLLHRSGRTGRAGRKGVSAVIVTPQTRRKAERILQGAKVTPTWGHAPSAEAVQARDADRMIEDPIWGDPMTDAESDAVTALTTKFDAAQIATAYLRLYHAKHSAPEELSDPGAASPPKPRAAFGPSVWFSLAGGRDAGAEPRRLLPMLCKAGGLTKDDIGAIRVQDQESFVEIKADSVPGFLKEIGAAMTVEDGAQLTQLKDAPAAARQPRPAFGSKPPRGKKPYADKGPRKSFDKKDGPAGKREDRHEDRRDDKKPRPAAAPIDWNDDPTPKRKKPKPEDRARSGAGGKPGHKGDKPPFKKRPRPEDSRPEGVVTKHKKRPGKPNGKPEGKPGGKPAGKPWEKSGAKPKSDGGGTPVGKPSSKKNRARRAAALDASKSLRKPRK
ncbi:UNVERIFIED_CONTAM: hypothetical protein GTU68_055597 [Idotea baltica]|nr:hypothetical protein [Idotea baltica]